MMHPPMGTLPTLKEISTGGGQLFKSFLTLTKSESSLFEGSASASETENKQALTFGDDIQKIRAMKQLLAIVTGQRHLDRLLPEVIKVMGTSNLELKRLCYLYVVLTCQKVLVHQRWENVQHESDVLLLTVNAFQKDTAHRNHIVRAWALRAMGSLQFPEVIASLTTAIYRGAADGSPSVRQAAALAAPKVITLDATLLGGIIENVVLRLIADVEPSVVSVAFQSLHEILLILPSLSSLETQDTSLFESLFGLNLIEKNVPFLSVLHPHFCRSVSEMLFRMTPHGQVAAIHVLTLYSRTFFSSPTSSPHFWSFIEKLWEVLQFTSSISVAITSANALMVLDNRDSVLTQVCPYLFHWLQLTGYALTPSGSYTLLDLLKEIAKRLPNIIIPEVPLLLLNFRDSTFINRRKLDLLEVLSDHAAFPFDLVFDDLITAAHWDVRSESNHHFVGEVLNSIIKISLKHIKVARDSKRPLNRCVQELMRLVIDNSSRILVNEAIRCLREVSLSQLSDSRHIHTIALHIANRLVDECAISKTVKNDYGQFQGCAAMIGLLTAHHDVVPRIAMDVFRVLVGASATGCQLTESPSVQLEIVNLGASLWSFHFHNKSESNSIFNRESNCTDVCLRLEELLRFLLSHLGANTNDPSIKDFVWLLSQLLSIHRCQSRIFSSSVHFTHSQKVFGSPQLLRSTITTRGELSCLSTLRFLSSTEFYPQWSLSFATSHPFRSLTPLPSFVASEEHRTLPPDSVRIPLVRQTNKSDECKKPTKGEPNDNDDELNAFYKYVGNRSTADDPFIRLFGANSSRDDGTCQQRGVIVFGEENESDNENLQVEEVQCSNPSSFDESISDEDDDWNAIKSSVPH